MSTMLRIILIVFSVINCVWVLTHIRKSRVKIEDSIFWLLFSFFLIVISLFPSLMTIAAQWAGVKSPVNFLFLVIIFLLQIKLFQLSIHVSQLEEKLKSFAQRYAIDRKDQEDQGKEERKERT